MAGGKLTVFNLGSGGVDVDTDPVLMSDEKVRSAQNAEHRAVLGRKGAVGNRNGYQRFITNPLNGAILGGIEMPIADTGGAPASGGGGNNTGSAIPGRSGTNLGAGLTIDTGATSTTVSTPASAGFGQSGTLFGGSRLVMIGRVDDNLTSDTQQGHGWYLTSKSLADNGLKVTTGVSGCIIGPPGFPTNIIRPTGGEVTMCGQNLYTYANNVLFFGKAIAENRGTDPVQPTLFRYDGHTQTTVCQFPVNSVLHTAGTLYRSSIVNVLVKYADGNTLYVAVADDVATGITSGYHGRVYKVTGLDAQAYVVTEIFNSAYSGNASGFVSNVSTNPYTPYAMENFGGSLWIGMWRGNLILNADNNPTVFKLNESGTHGVVSNAQVINHTATNQSDISVMKRMFGSLFFGTRDFYNTAAGPSGPPQFASIYKLDPDGTLTLSKSINDGGTAASSNLVVSMAEFNGNLYVSAYNGPLGAETSIIYKYDGTSWTTAFTQGAGTKTPFNLAVDDGVIYAFGSIGSTSTNTRFYISTDGASWTEKTFDDANFDSHDHVLNFLYGFNQ